MTKFILESHPQTGVWVSWLLSFPITLETQEIWQGGFRSYNESQLDAIQKAFLKFEQNNDTKAVSGVYLTWSSDLVYFVMGHHLF